MKIKKLIFFLLFFNLLFSAYTLQGQAWRTIKPNGVFIFQTNYFEKYFAYRIDSVLTIGNDTIYKSYPVIKRISFDCYSENTGSWIGKQVIIRPDGMNIFINYNNDSIKIKTLAQIGQSWLLCSTGNTTATVSSLKDTIILGMQDSIKIITLNSSLQGINGMKITFSKHYGLIRTPDFFDFPNNTNYSSTLKYYTLCGISDPQVGIQNPTLKEVYSYNIGDEFHIYTFSKQSFFFPDHENESWAIYAVIDTLPTLSEDTLKYFFKRCKTERYSYYGATPYYETYTTYNDTIIVTKVLNDSVESVFNRQPGEPVYTESGLSAYQIEIHPSNIVGKVAPSIGYTDFNNSNCWSLLCADGCFTNEISYNGIYGSYYYCFYIYAREESKLVYYKKGNQSWGTPYDCQSIINTAINEQNERIKVLIAPNPASDYFSIITDRSSNEDMTFVLYDIYGSLISSTNINSSITTINCNNLADGIYFYRLIGKAGIIGNGKIILQ